MTTVVDHVNPLMFLGHGGQSVSLSRSVSHSLTALLFASEMPLVYCHYYVQVNPTPAGYRLYQVSGNVCGPSPSFVPTETIHKNTFPRSNLVKMAAKYL